MGKWSPDYLSTVSTVSVVIFTSILIFLFKGYDSSYKEMTLSLSFYRILTAC